MPMPTRFVEAPNVPDLPYGLLSVAQVRNIANRGGTTVFQTVCGTTTALAPDPCDPAPGTSEVQTITITGAPTGGTFTLSYGGSSTTALAFNANAAAVQAALESLPQFNPGDLSVTGTNPNFTVTFTGPLASTNVAQITATHAFTGGTTPNIATATTTQGVRTPKTATTTLTDITSQALTVYTRFDCRPVGVNVAEMQSKAMDALTVGESFALEREFRLRFTATDITPAGGPVNPVVGAALLEGHAGANYKGQPVLHTNRTSGGLVLAGGYSERRGNHLETQQGALHSSGGGYHLWTDIADGETVMYVSGQVLVERGSAVVNSGQVHNAANTTNDFVTIAERQYNLSVDCNYVASVRVTNVSA